MQEYISKLLDRNEMRIVDREVNPKHELAAVVARSQKESALPILFKRVQGTEFPVVCNLYGSRSRLKEMVGAGAIELRRKYPTLQKAWDKYKTVWHLIN